MNSETPVELYLLAFIALVVLGAALHYVIVTWPRVLMWVSTS